MANNRVTGKLSGTINGNEKRIEWTIPNISSSFKIATFQNFYESPSFNFVTTSLYLKLYLPSSTRIGWLSVYLVHESGSSCNLISSFSIKRSDGTLIATKTGKFILSNQSNKDFIEFYPAFEILNSAHQFMPDTNLTIVCDLKLELDRKTPPTEDAKNLNNKEAVGNTEMNLTEIELLSMNFKDLLTDEDSCDVVLLVQSKEFKAHKLILTARSSVFANMFRHETIEKKTMEVVIPDCDPDSFQEFLEYLYSGRLNNVSSNSALHLYYTSDKYNVLELKAFCTKHLMENLLIQNICDVILLADQYDETDLLSAAQNFFNSNLEKILVTIEWETLFKKNFRLANKLLINMSKQGCHGTWKK